MKIGDSSLLDSGLSSQSDKREHCYQVNDQKRRRQQEIQRGLADVIGEHHRKEEKEREHSDENRPLDLGGSHRRRFGNIFISSH